jgi:class 3 adenylate cyclase
MDLGAWLRGLGLGQYEAAFGENDVDAAVLPSLTAEDLKEIGVASVGHRRRLLDAIAALRDAPSPAAPPAAPEQAGTASGAERRQLTVLFCDLAGSTALSARLDPEDMREVMAAYHRAATEAVQGQGGHVAKFLGDGVLAYFGWPRAQRTTPSGRCVRASPRRRAVAGLRTPAGPLAARIGIATGTVVVGEVLGEGEAREWGVVGETPNVAARLQGLAEPGAVVLDEATRRLIGGLFDYADLGEVGLKGLPRPVRAWRALGEGRIESRFEALRAGTHAAPLVGHGEELELLLRRWRRARAREGQVVVLRGEAGIGKSRLVAALREALTGEEHEELVLHCSSQHTDSALRPVIARLERAAGLAPGDAPETRLAKLEALLAPLAPPPEDVALTAELLSVPTLGRWPMPDLTPQRRRERLLQALCGGARVGRAAAGAGGGRGRALGGPDHARAARPAGRRGAAMALLLVVTHRPEFDAGAWIGAPHVTPVQLNRLARAEHWTCCGGWRAARRCRRRWRRRSWRTGRRAAVRGGGRGGRCWRRAAARGGGPLGARRARCRPRGAGDAAGLAGGAAGPARPGREGRRAGGGAIGREFDQDLLAAAVDMPDHDLAPALRRLEDAGLVHRRGAPPGATYSFRHALLRDAAYGMLLRGQRRTLHARVAEALEELRPEAAEREPQVLAWHCANAGLTDRAVALWRRAGERSAARYANLEAAEHFRRALERSASWRRASGGTGSRPSSASRRRCRSSPPTASGRRPSRPLRCARRSSATASRAGPGRSSRAGSRGTRACCGGRRRGRWRWPRICSPRPRRTATRRASPLRTERSGTRCSSPASWPRPTAVLERGAASRTAWRIRPSPSTGRTRGSSAGSISARSAASWAIPARRVGSQGRARAGPRLGQPPRDRLVARRPVPHPAARARPVEAERIATEAIDISSGTASRSGSASRSSGADGRCAGSATSRTAGAAEEGLRRMRGTGAVLHTTIGRCLLADGCLQAGDPRQRSATGGRQSTSRCTATVPAAEIHRSSPRRDAPEGGSQSECEGHLREAQAIARGQARGCWSFGAPRPRRLATRPGPRRRSAGAARAGSTVLHRRLRTA